MLIGYVLKILKSVIYFILIYVVNLQVRISDKRKHHKSMHKVAFSFTANCQFHMKIPVFIFS